MSAYRVLVQLFYIMNEQEQKNLLMYFVKEINLNPHWEKKSPLKSIEFNFPIYEDSEETVFVCEEKSSVERNEQKKTNRFIKK